ncbi:MAG: alpha/beta fold hydrolase [Acidimicrobiia bacterium]
MKSQQNTMTASLGAVNRWVWLPVGIAAGTYYAAPRILKRAFAPPQRDARQTPRDLGLPEERVWLESVNGTLLHGWFIPVEDRAPAVIVLHGWGGNAALMLPLAPHFHRAGFHALFLDARNHGLSEHDKFTSMPRFAEDLEVAVDWLQAHPEVSSVGVIGHSVGAGAAILSASRGDKLDAVVSISAPAHPGDMMRRQMTSIPKPVLTLILAAIQRIIGYRFDAFAPRNRIGLVQAPVMLVHGADDTVVSIDSLYELAAAHPTAETLVVADAAHSDLAPFENRVGDIIEFLRRSLHR